jgi:hypothetical protein
MLQGKGKKKGRSSCCVLPEFSRERAAEQGNVEYKETKEKFLFQKKRLEP